MQHELHKWKKYMSNDDYIYFIKYIDNAKNKIPNDRLLIFFGNEIGKKLIIREISNYVGNANFMLSDTYGCGFFRPTVKIVHIPGIDNYQPKYIQQLVNIIQYGQSIIGETFNVKNIDSFILENSKIINII